MFAWILKNLSGLLIFMAAAASLWFFAGFADNDGGLWHLLSAAALCFGVASLFIGPLFFGQRIASAFVKNGRTAVHVKWIFILFLPWLPLGVYTVMLGGRWLFLGGVILGVSILYLIWAASVAAKKN